MSLLRRSRKRTPQSTLGEGVSALTKATLTLTWDEIPEWQRDNEHITSGYRRIQESWIGCYHSVFGYIHNETVNIHTHLCGLMIFVFLLSSFYASHISAYETTTWLDVLVFVIFLVSAVTCLAFSTCFHALACHSREICVRFNILDYAGIVVLIVGSFYPIIYYSFFCESHWQIMYLVALTLAGFAAGRVVMNREYLKPTHRGARTLVFIGLGLAGLAPTLHINVTAGFATLWEWGFGWVLAEAFLYISGALIYANRVPERLAPGRFDFWFSSHQIFHVHVVLAACSHYVAVLTIFHHRHALPQVCTF